MSQNNNELDNNLVGYAIIISLIASGIITQLKFDSIGEVIGIFLITLGLFTLGIQLVNEKLIKYTFASFGMTFLYPSIFLSNFNNLILSIFFIILISLSITFFSIGIIYSLKKKQEHSVNEIKKINKKRNLGFLDILSKTVEVVGLGFAIYDLLTKLAII